MKNAQIERTFLGREDHGLMTFFVHFDFGDGLHQGYGGYSLGGRRHPSPFGIAAIEALLDTVGVTEWDMLRGQYVRVEYEDPSAFNSKIIRIYNITDDTKYLDLDEIAKEVEGAHH